VDLFPAISALALSSNGGTVALRKEASKWGGIYGRSLSRPDSTRSSGFGLSRCAERSLISFLKYDHLVRQPGCPALRLNEIGWVCVAEAGAVPAAPPV